MGYLYEYRHDVQTPDLCLDSWEILCGGINVTRPVAWRFGGIGVANGARARTGPGEWVVIVHRLPGEGEDARQRPVPFGIRAFRE